MKRLVRLSCVVSSVFSVSIGFAQWLPPSTSGIQIIEDGQGQWKVSSSVRGAFALDSSQKYEARPDEAFEISMSIRVDRATAAMPELVCYDASGREIRPRFSTRAGGQNTLWQSFRRVFPTEPGTTSVRARIRASGRGDFWLKDFEFRPVKIDPYETGALIRLPQPSSRGGLVLESNFGMVNTDQVTEEDRDGDGKWALVYVDLDRISEPEWPELCVDQRTCREFRLTEYYWSDGAVLKSDSVLETRSPDLQKALHFRMRAHVGPYRAILSDPGRAVAVSLDGKNWKRYEGGREAEIGTIGAKDGFVEFWIDNCYRDPYSAGPVYFDYVRLFPIDNTPSVDRLFAAARRAPKKLLRGSVEEKKVTVAVNGLQFREGTNWPVRCGLPIPEGELASPENASVIDSQGTPVPSQNRVMATWPDGSVKWLFLDFNHDFSKGTGGRYTVSYGNRVRRALPHSQIHIQSTAAGLEVDTGAIRFLVPKAHFGIVENVRTASGKVLQSEPIDTKIIETGGKTWRALDLPVEKLEIEQPGPMHAVILAETKLPESGKPASGFAYRARIHVYAQSSLLQVDYFVANTDSRPVEGTDSSMAGMVKVKSIVLTLKPAAPMKTVVYELGRSSAPGSLTQKTEEIALLENAAGEREEVRRHLQGWLGAELQSGDTIYAGVEAFREQFPKALRWRPEELQVSLWAEEGGDFEWYEGVGKTHHISLFYGSGAPSGGALLSRGPVLALADPEWYCRSGAFGQITPASDSKLPVVEKTLATHIKSAAVGGVGLGFENYGDHRSAGYVLGYEMWENNEYDQVAGALVHFARTGDTDALRIGLAGALHYADVDTIHYSSRHADWKGATHTHTHRPFGHHTAQGPDMGHAGYVQGSLWYTYLTGDPDGIDGAKSMAAWVLRNINPEMCTKIMERQTGLPLTTLNALYEATWDETYLRGAARLVDWAMKWEHPTRGGFLGPFAESPAFYSGSPFCAGTLSAALIKFNSWAKLPEIDRMLERGAIWTLTDAWRPPSKIERKAGSTRGARGAAESRHIASNLQVMAHAFATSKNPLFLAVPRECLIDGFGQNVDAVGVGELTGKTQLKFGFGTRTTGLVFNYLPWFLTTLEQAGNPVPEPQLEVLPQTTPVTVGKGSTIRVLFRLRNAGTTPIENLRPSFQTRLDFKVTPITPVPAALNAGQEIDLSYEIQAPQLLNLTCDYNRIAYAHWNALYTRDGTPHVAHTWLKVTVQ